MRLEPDVKKRVENRSESNEGLMPEGICDTHPHFATDHSGEAQAVILDKSSYVKLLIDARITDEECWPPGLEKCAALLGRLVEIEEAGLAKYGTFAPEKLSRKLQNEYLELNLALDDIQSELQEELRLGEVDIVEDTENEEADAKVFTPPSSFAKFAAQLAAKQHEYKTWEEYPTIHNNEHFA